MGDHISRKGFIKRAAAGAAAASGVASADYFPPTPVPDPSGNVVDKENRVIVYPTGVEDADWGNLDLAINYRDKDVHLMDHSKDGVKMNFKLPTCDQCEGYYGVEITRDVNIFGQGKDATIEGGMTAFYSNDGYSLSIEKLNFINQILSAVYGYFVDFESLVSNVSPLPPPRGKVSNVSPLPPPPSPEYGFLLAVSGSLNITKSQVNSAQVGILCAGAPNGGKISSTNVTSGKCALYLAGADEYLFDNALVNIDVSGNLFSIGEQGIANILLEGLQVTDNRFSGNKFKGDPAAGNLIIWQQATNTFVRMGKGSVSNVSPLPPPDPSVIDYGTNSDIKGSANTIEVDGSNYGQYAPLVEELSSIKYWYFGGD